MLNTVQARNMARLTNSGKLIRTTHTYRTVLIMGKRSAMSPARYFRCVALFKEGALGRTVTSVLVRRQWDHRKRLNFQ